MAGSAIDEKWSIEKLDNSNWTTWKFQMLHLLLAKGLWGHVDGTEVLAEDANAQAQAEFRKKSQRAFSTIVLAVSTSQLYLITSCEQPKDAWDVLKKHFERDTLANKLFLKKRYFRTEMKEGTSMESHLKHMKELTDKLAAIDAPITEEDQVVTLLGSLPQSYSTLVTALEARVDDIKLDFVQQALIHEELKMKGKNNSEEQGDSALIGKFKKTVKPQNLRCYHCGQAGHFHRDCPKRKQRNNSEHKAKTVVGKPPEVKLDDHPRESAFATCTSASSKGLPQVDKWLVDSGASSHMTSNKKTLANFREFKKPEKVGLGDGHTVDAIGVGNVYIRMQLAKGESKEFVIHKVLYVPNLACNLFSVRTAASKGKSVKFIDDKCWIYNRAGDVCGMGSLVDKLYHLDCELVPSESVSVAFEKSRVIDLWHQRLGHPGKQRLSLTVNKQLVSGINVSKMEELSFCEGCVEGKIHRQSFQPVGEIRSTEKLQLVHSDVCGPMSTDSIGGRKYFVTFTDDYSRCCSVYFIKHKYEVFEKFKEFETAITTSSGQRIRRLRTDNGGEYVSKEFENYLKSREIFHEFTVPHSPEQNGVAERMNRTLVESARSMLSHAGLSKSFWAEAIATAAYIRNRMPTAAIREDKTPYEKWYGRKPDVSNLRVFGCMAYAHIPESQRKKLDKKSEKLRFVGYSIQSKGYRLFDENQKVIVRRDVVFNETDSGQAEEKLTDKFDVDVSQGEANTPVVEQQQRPQRQRRPPVRYGQDEYADTVMHAFVHHVTYNVNQVQEPKSLEEALATEHANQWRAAADSEFESLMKNETWKLVELPSDRKPIGCKWVFKVKYCSDGKIERFKARLVAKGYAQKYGIDYDETFSPVVRFSSIRALLAYAVQNDLLIHQMDVVTAFLNGNLEEEIYMEQPDGYIQPGKENLVCKLQKSLYGLKQSPRCWNTAFQEYMEVIQFKQSTADPCIYVKMTDAIAILAVYVDDLIVMASTLEEMQQIKETLKSRFQMKDLGKLHYCLGISIEQDEERKCLWIHQKQYILNMLEKYSLSNAKVVSTPADVSVQLKKDDGVSNKVDSVTYQSIIGSLLYAAIATRPDIAQAVGVVAKFSSSPNQSHLTAAKRILRYLKGTLNLAIRYQKLEDEELIGYTDADWAGDLDDRHSTTGNIFMMGGGPVSWLSKKQAIVALSTSEAEYVALSFATQEVVWLMKLLITDLKSTSQKPTVLMEDNQGAISIAKNPVAHARTKHIDIRYHYIREAVQNGTINLCFCPSENMIADLLTKPLPRGRFTMLRDAMGLTELLSM